MNENIFLRNCGIYMITCLENGQFYIGSSNNIEKRWKYHRNDLRKGIHINKKFQNCWNKYGEKSFKYKILYLCEEEYLEIFEQCYLNYFCNEFVNGVSRCKNEVLNLSSISGRFPSNKGVHHSADHKKNLSLVRKGKHHSADHKKNLSLVRKGKHHSAETKMRMSLAKKGKYCGENNFMYGKHHSDAVKKKISDTHKGENNPMSLKNKERRRLAQLILLINEK